MVDDRLVNAQVRLIPNLHFLSFLPRSPIVFPLKFLVRFGIQLDKKDLRRSGTLFIVELTAVSLCTMLPTHKLSNTWIRGDKSFWYKQIRIIQQNSRLSSSETRLTWKVELSRKSELRAGAKHTEFPTSKLPPKKPFTWIKRFRQ
jgi:hypothetical protein